MRLLNTKYMHVYQNCNICIKSCARTSSSFKLNYGVNLCVSKRVRPSHAKNNPNNLLTMLIINVDKQSFDSHCIYTNDLASFASPLCRYVSSGRSCQNMGIT